MAVSGRYPYAYPRGWRSNTEAAFFFAGRLVLVPKTTPARLYRFDQPLTADRLNQPRLVASLPGSATVSLARVAPDQRTLVVANQKTLFFYRTPAPARALRPFAARLVRRQRIAADNVEAGDYFPLGACKLVLFAESRNVYRIRPGRPLPGTATPSLLP